MKLIDGKSVLLGMGLGIIITSILGVIFFAGFKPQLSDADVIDMAKKLGMVDRYSQSQDIKRNPDGSLMFKVSEGESFTSVSKRLYDAGIISSSIEFEIMIKKENLQDAIKPGEYSISFQDDTKAIIKKITQSP
ncbi:MAG: endolytic transglycosylase MltG [Clostridia bacterium]|nr:endolytic transglycosylase MltG [Clostridia bacterium]